MTQTVLERGASHWHFAMPSSFDNALVAIASVAAVVWTGGLIIRQLYPQYVTIAIQNGVEYCMFASIASIFGLILNGWPLSLVAAVFFAVYGYQWVQSLLLVYNLNRNPDSAYPSWVADRAKYERDTFDATRLEGWLLTPYPLVIGFPYQGLVAIISVVVLYCGYQLILFHMNTAWSSPAMKEREEAKVARVRLKAQQQAVKSIWRTRVLELLIEIRDRFSS